MKIILGSQSKNRKLVLEKMGYEFEVMSSNIDEKSIRDDDPKQLVLKLARAKAQALLPKIQEPSILITSDQVVFCNNEIREKPESVEQAREYLETLSRYPQETVTSLVIMNTSTGKTTEAVDIAKVYFRTLPDSAIEEFISKGDPYTHSGGFAVEDPILKPYVEKIEGEYESVLGLPKALTKKFIQNVQ